MTRPAPDGTGDPTAAVEVVLTGDLDIASYEQARERVEEADRTGPAVLVIDLSALEFVDSTGVRLVLDADQRARAQGRRVAVRLGTGQAERVFRTLGLLDVLEVVPDPDGDAATGRAAP